MPPCCCLPQPRRLRRKTILNDPFNGPIDPKAIPGSEIAYVVTVTNQGAGNVDADALLITDPLPADSCMVVLDIARPGSGPVEFQDGTPSSSLSYSFASLGSGVDDLDFSDDGGLTFNYDPSPGAFGCDPAVTNIRVNPTGTFAADTGAGSPSAQVTFHVIVN